MADRAMRRPSGHLLPGAWADRSRDRIRHVDPALLAQARRNSEEASHDTGFLFSLADEVARTRAAELARGHRTLVNVMPGFKNTRPRGGRPAAVAAHPCVVLVVRRKRGLADDDRQRLPDWLVTYADRDGTRRPYAIPTDVQDASEHRGFRTHHSGELWAQRSGFDRSFGHYAALVQPEGDATVYLMSAMHVLSPDLDAAAPSPFALDLLPVDPSGHPLAQPRVATGEVFGGRLVPDPGDGSIVSLDVQLARVEDDQLTRMTSMCPLRGLDAAHGIAMDAADLAEFAGQANRFELLRADNNPFGSPPGPVLLALSASTPAADLPYDFARDGGEVSLDVVHHGLLRFDAITPAIPRGGDSGSAIVFRNEADGRLTLVGMHIAGDGKGASLAIPAWLLFDTSGWDAAPAGALALIDPG